MGLIGLGSGIIKSRNQPLKWIYDQLLENSGVELIRGRGVIVDSNTVTVGDRTLSTKRILIATGGGPVNPKCLALN